MNSSYDAFSFLRSSLIGQQYFATLFSSKAHFWSMWEWFLFAPSMHFPVYFIIDVTALAFPIIPSCLSRITHWRLLFSVFLWNVMQFFFPSLRAPWFYLYYLPPVIKHETFLSFFNFIFFVDTITDIPHPLPTHLPTSTQLQAPFPLAITTMSSVSMGYEYMFLC